MSRCETTEALRVELADWTPIQQPDGLWCVWSERTQLPIKLGSKQAALLSDVSKAMGSIDRAHDAFRAAHADPDRWARLLASLPPATARYLASKVGEPVERPALAPLRPAPVSSVSNPYLVGDQPPARGEVVKAAPALPAVTYGRNYTKTPGGHRRNRANTPKYDDKIRTLHAQGLHTGAIAAQLRCKEQTVRNAYTRLGVTGHRKPTESYKPRVSPPHPKDAQIKALHAEGLHNAAIARRCELGDRVVDGRVRALGLTRNKAQRTTPAPVVATPEPAKVPPTKRAPATTAPTKDKKPKAAAGGKSRSARIEEPAPPTRQRPYSRRWVEQCKAARRADAVSMSQAQAVLRSEGSYTRAASKLGLTTYRLKLLIEPGGYKERRAELVRVAVRALKAAGASLREVYDLGVTSPAKARAIYNGDETT